MQNKLSVETIFKNLEGKWNFTRTILDKIENTNNLANGVVVFINKGLNNSLFYLEEGVLELEKSKRKFNFNRKYIFKLENNQINIYFDDGISKGKLYQTLNPLQDKKFIGTEHLCINDLYSGTYNFNTNEEFSITYKVKGPKKDLVINTIFKKI